MVATSSTAGSLQQCGSCGATVEVEPSTNAGSLLSTSCAYCGSQLVDAARGGIAVDMVAPFRIPKSAAEDRLRAHLAGRWWIDSKLRKAAKAGQVRPASLRGVLVPFYAYTATVRASYRARIGLHWYREETVQVDGKKQTKRIQETEWFDLRGSAVDELDNYLVEASVGLSPDEARRLLPYDLGLARPFDSRLLAGWLAEMPSRSRAEVDRSARQSIWDHEQQRLRNRLLPGDRARVKHFDCDIDIHGVKLALLPVWIASIRHGDRVYRLLVHGQDGRCFGEAPLAKGRIAFAIVLALVFVALVVWFFSGEGPTWM